MDCHRPLLATNCL